MKRAAIATGGTGGHIYPALALASEIRKEFPDCEIRFFGNDDRMEAQLIPAEGYPFVGLHTSGLTGSLLDKAKAGYEQVQAVMQARKALKEFQPEIVAGFGGYVSTPVLLAASSLHIPTIVHEQNSIAGKANKLLANTADRFIICYEGAAESFPAAKTRLLGNPRGAVAAASQGDRDYYESLGLDPRKETILVMMGSLGSSSVNELLTKALAEPIPGVQFLFTVGKDNEGDLELFAGRDDIITVPYVDTLKIYPFISGLVCRAGATTLSELTAIGLPAILIPSPYVANNHQYHNAKALEKEGAAKVLEERELEEDPGRLREMIRQFLAEPQARMEAAACAKALGRSGAAADMVREMEDMIHGA